MSFYSCSGITAALTRQKEHNPDAFGLTRFVVGRNASQHYAACSSLHFAPIEAVEWRAVFREKLMEDMDVELI